MQIPYSLKEYFDNLDCEQYCVVGVKDEEDDGVDKSDSQYSQYQNIQGESKKKKKRLRNRKEKCSVLEESDHGKTACKIL